METLQVNVVCIFDCRGIVRGQTNIAEHDPEVCKDKYQEWGSDECPVPQFSGSTPQVSNRTHVPFR